MKSRLSYTVLSDAFHVCLTKNDLPGWCHISPGPSDGDSSNWFKTDVNRSSDKIEPTTNGTLCTLHYTVHSCGSDPSVFLDLTWFPLKFRKWRLAEELAVECRSKRIIKLSHSDLFYQFPIPLLNLIWRRIRFILTHVITEVGLLLGTGCCTDLYTLSLRSSTAL